MNKYQIGLAAAVLAASFVNNANAATIKSPGSVQQQKQWTWCSNAILIGYRPHSSSASRFTAGASGS